MPSALNRYIDKHFLIIDDFADFRVAIKQMLESIGIKQIETCSTGEEAIELYAQANHDVVFCDFNLGEGISGLQVYEELNYRGLLQPHTLFLILTGESTVSLVTGAIDFKPDDYLVKPFTKSTLKARLDKAYSKKKLLEPINKALNAEKFALAAAHCEQVAAKHVRLANACNKIHADCLLKLNQVDSAISIYQTALLKGTQAWAQLGYSRCLIHQHQYIEAIHILEELLERNKFSIEAYDLKAECEKATGQNEAAFHTLTDAVELSPNAPNRLRALGELALAFHKLPIAQKAYRQAIRLSRNTTKQTPLDYVRYAQIQTLLFIGNKGVTTRRVLHELSNHTKVTHRHNPKDIQLQLAMDIHTGLMQLLTSQKEKSNALLSDVVVKIHDLPDKPHSYLLDEIKFAYKHASDNTHIENLYRNIYEPHTQFITQDEPIKANSENAKGMEYFQAKNFEAAYLAFKSAFLNSQNNVNIALNLMQAMYKLLTKEVIDKEFEPLLTMAVNSCRTLNASDHRFEHFQSLLKNIRIKLSAQQLTEENSNE
ncbi:response regulator [Flocculibacter collagenilyticus]|uniref:response regulator n=1 Tax=Flocculibacter collagenilyticus TaxID=2744479 RepID=UPI0018F2EE8A|nr:response regulator [Flocculibacter collagenilyticus]